MRTQTRTSNKLTGAARKKMSPSDFGIPTEREFPMPDAAHVHAAEAYFRYADDKKKPLLAHRILLKAKKYGVDIESEVIRDWAKKYKNRSNQ